MVAVGDGEWARASVILRIERSTVDITASLRWKRGGRVQVRELGVVRNTTRFKNLAEGWRMARLAGLLAEGRLPTGSWASSVGVRASMRGNRGRDTKPEIALRTLLHKRGLRYRVSARPLPEVRRTADIVFPKARVAVFVDGCFWHGCPDHHRPSAVNAGFWRDKIEGNRARDRETTAMLVARGWRVIRMWEHEDPEQVARFVEAEVRVVPPPS